MTRYYRMRAVNTRPVMKWEMATSRQRTARRMNNLLWAIASVGNVLGLTSYRDTVSKHYGAVLVAEISPNGRYIKVCRLGTVTDPETPDTWGSAVWKFASDYYRLADSLSEYKLLARIAELEASIETTAERAKWEAQQDTRKLSRNTVTRALVHAHDNDYCAETAVALISAGHKLPDITLDVEVTLRGNITLEGKTNYYALRRLFGATRGEVEDASGLDVGEYANVSEAITEAISAGEFFTDNVAHLGTSAEWFDPIIRRDASDLDSNESFGIMNANSNY